MMVCLRSDTFTAGSTSAFPCIIVAGENGTSRPTLMGCHDYYHTSLQFITSISSPVYLLLCCFFHLSVLIFFIFFLRCLSSLSFQSVAPRTQMKLFLFEKTAFCWSDIMSQGHDRRTVKHSINVRS